MADRRSSRTARGSSTRTRRRAREGSSSSRSRRGTGVKPVTATAPVVVATASRRRSSSSHGAGAGAGGAREDVPSRLHRGSSRTRRSVDPSLPEEGFYTQLRQRLAFVNRRGDAPQAAASHSGDHRASSNKAASRSSKSSTTSSQSRRQAAPVEQAPAAPLSAASAGSAAGSIATTASSSSSSPLSSVAGTLGSLPSTAGSDGRMSEGGTISGTSRESKRQPQPQPQPQAPVHRGQQPLNPAYSGSTCSARASRCNSCLLPAPHVLLVYLQTGLHIRPWPPRRQCTNSMKQMPWYGVKSALHGSVHKVTFDFVLPPDTQ